MRRRVLLLLLAVVLVALGVAGWSGWRALQVRSDLTAAQATVTQLQAQLKAGQVSEAEAALPGLRTRLDRAAGRTGGPVWTVAEHLPVLGRNLHVVRRIAQAAQALGDRALPEATAALHLVRGGALLRDGRVDLTVLEQLRGHVQLATQAADRAQALLAPGDEPLLATVRSKLTEARLKVVDLDRQLRSAQTALDVAPAMLGQGGRRHYFVAVQNNAEARATGGLVGAFALVTADHGKITLDRTGTDTELRVADKPVPSDPAAAQFWKDEGSTQAWYDVNLTPHFPDAAQNLAGQWTAQSGQRLDGVIALDPIVMSELLTATGPVTLPDGTAVSASSVVDFVGHDEYVRYTDVPKRKALLGTLAADLFHRVIAAGDGFRTLQAFARAGSSGHLFLWSAHPTDQARLAATLVGGTLPTQDSPYLSVLTQNYGGDKLDFYVRRSVRVTRQRDGRLQLTVVLRNTAPLGLPDYMTVRSDNPSPPLPYGQAKVGLTVYGALSSEIGQVKVDGRQALMSFDHDHGHLLGTLNLELPRGKDVTVTLLLTEPRGVLVYRQQPLVIPDTLALDLSHVLVGRH